MKWICFKCIFKSILKVEHEFIVSPTRTRTITVSRQIYLYHSQQIRLNTVFIITGQ